MRTLPRRHRSSWSKTGGDKPRSLLQSPTHADVYIAMEPEIWGRKFPSQWLSSFQTGGSALNLQTTGGARFMYSLWWFSIFTRWVLEKIQVPRPCPRPVRVKSPRGGGGNGVGGGGWASVFLLKAPLLQTSPRETGLRMIPKWDLHSEGVR